MLSRLSELYSEFKKNGELHSRVAPAIVLLAIILSGSCTGEKYDSSAFAVLVPIEKCGNKSSVCAKVEFGAKLSEGTYSLYAQVPENFRLSERIKIVTKVDGDWKAQDASIQSRECTLYPAEAENIIEYGWITEAFSLKEVVTNANFCVSLELEEHTPTTKNIPEYIVIGITRSDDLDLYYGGELPRVRLHEVSE